MEPPYRSKSKVTKGKGEGVAEGVGVFEPEAEREVLVDKVIVEVGVGVIDGEAPWDKEEVGDDDTVPLAVPVPLEVGVTEPVPLLEAEGDTLGL